MSAGAGTSPWHLRKRSAAGLGYRPKQYRGVVRGGRASGYMLDLGQRHQNHVRGCGVLYGKNKPTPTAVLYNKRIHQNEPITVAHDIKQELRSEPGSQAVVAMIGERLLPRPDYSGALLRHVNRTDYAGTTNPTVPFHLYNEFIGAGSTAPTTGVPLNHRRDWTMGTNASWRDGFAIVNGQLNTEALMESGYATPYLSENLYGDPTRWHQAPAVIPTGGSGISVSMNPLDPASANAVVLRNYYHLYEEISWKIQNNSVTGTTVTIYECVLNRDIPLNDTNSFSSTPQVVQWAGMPCPLELWRQSQELRYAKTGQVTTDGDFALNGLPINGIPVAEDEGAGVASAGFQRDPTAPGATRGMDTADIDYPNVRPDKASLLHTYYKVRAHTRYLPPGADTTITVGVRYNKRIPGAWWNTMYGVADFTRCFFMVSRPDEVVGITGGDGSSATAMDGKNRLPVMNATDLMVSWTKKKTVCKAKQRMRVKYWFKSAIPSVVDVAIRNPITLKVHDADVFMGEDADEAPEAPGA